MTVFVVFSNFLNAKYSSVKYSTGDNVSLVSKYTHYSNSLLISNTENIQVVINLQMFNFDVLKVFFIQFVINLQLFNFDVLKFFGVFLSFLVADHLEIDKLSSHVLVLFIIVSVEKCWILKLNYIFVKTSLYDC